MSDRDEKMDLIDVEPCLEIDAATGLSPKETGGKMFHTARRVCNG